MNASHDTLGGFESRLLSELRARLEAMPSHAPARRRPIVYGAIAFAAVAAVAAGSGAAAWQLTRDSHKTDLAQLPRDEHVGPAVASASGWTLYVAPNHEDWELDSADLRSMGRFEPGASSAAVAEEGTGAVVLGVLRGAGNAPVELRMPGREPVSARANAGYFLVAVDAAPPRGSSVVAPGTALDPVPVAVP